MIYQLSRDIETKLQYREFPVVVRYGLALEERDGLSQGMAILIERDRETGDAVVPIRGAAANPKGMRIRLLGCVATVWAQSTVDGPQPHENEHEVDRVVDALIIAIAEWGTEARAGDITFGSGRFLNAEELNGMRGRPGEVYQFTFTVPRGVVTKTYVDAIRPTGQPSTVSNSTQVTLKNATDGADAVTGCGS